MAKESSTSEVEIVRFFETGSIEKAEVVFNIVREKMRERLREHGADGSAGATERRPRRRRGAAIGIEDSDGENHGKAS